MFGFDLPYILLMIVIFGASSLVGRRLKSKFKKYAKLHIGLSGKEVAEKMLRESGIHDVTVQSVPGALTDHYNPKTKTVNLSEWVYNQKTVSAAAVAAHECGHAVQHAEAYQWLEMRSALVPAVSVSSKMMMWPMIIGFVMLASGMTPIVFYIGIAMFAMTTLFTFVTLPVEFDASNRALAWLDRTNTLHGEYYDGAKDALRWAAMTYVVAALASLAQLLYWIARANRR